MSGTKSEPQNSPKKCAWKPASLTDNADKYHHTLRYQTIERPKICPNILHTVGNTPMVRLNRIPKEYGLSCEVVAKCDFFNAGGSLKDRIALKMIEEAEKTGELKPGSVLTEPTSGNTGTGLALVSSIKGYRCVLVIQEKVSSDKRAVMNALGCEIIAVPNNLKMDHPGSKYNVARRLSKDIPNAVFLNQYDNPNNPMTHYETTAEEIIAQCDGKIDMIVISVGTAGSITGIGRKFKEKLPNCKVVGVDPIGSNLARPEVLNATDVTHYELEGVGFERNTGNLDHSVVDMWVKVSDEDSFVMARDLIQHEGLLCGGSSGSAVVGATRAAKSLKEGQRCVVLMNDTARNYVSKYMSDTWMCARGYMQVPKSITEKHGWWKRKISSMESTNHVTINWKMSCKDTVFIMKRENLEHLPVVDETGQFRGVVSLNKIVKKLLDRGLRETVPVEEIANPTVLELELKQTLGQLSQALLTDNYAVIIQRQKMYLNKTQTKVVKRLVGFVSTLQFADYITTHKFPHH